MDARIGVFYLPDVNPAKPWKTQITRGGRNFGLGTFAKSDEACRAYDNAVYYLRPWSLVTAPIRFNFPEDWEGEIPPASIETLRAMRILAAEKPGALKEPLPEELGPSQRLERTSLELLSGIREYLLIVEKRIAETVVRLGDMEVQLEAAQADIAQRDNIIEGLRAQGGKQFFKKVGRPEYTNAVESHLM